MNITIYRLLTILFSPLIDLYLFVRLLRKKEDKTRFKERFGYATKARPKGKLVWFHAASVGEANVIMPVILKLVERYQKQNVNVLFTSGSVTSADVISKKIKNLNIIHQYVPIDKYFVIKRFLKYWKPNAFFTIESEIWPNIVTMTKQQCPVVIINGKMSEKSLNSWEKKPGLKKDVFSCIDFCYPQSAQDEERFAKLRVQNMKYLGNLKFDVPVLDYNKEKLEELQNSIKCKEYVWAAASTHECEEEKIAEIHLALKKKYNNLLSVIILRHPQRSDDVCNMLKTKFNLNVAVRTKNDVINKNTDILLCDTIGEMGIFYRVFDVILMCGSLVDGIGGHTPIEPAKLNCAILTAPYIFNNKSLFVELEKNNACIIVKKEDMLKNLIKEIDILLSDKVKKEKLKHNALDITTKVPNIQENVIKEIDKFALK